MKELTHDQKEALKRIRRSELKDSAIYLLFFGPTFMLSVAVISAVGTFLLHSEEFIQITSAFNGVFMAFVFLSAAKRRSDKYRAESQKVLNQQES